MHKNQSIFQKEMKNIQTNRVLLKAVPVSN